MKPPEATSGGNLALLWAGMVLGVSFLATPAKFLAPSLSRSVALDVGQHTFRVFGRIELGLAALLGWKGAPRRPLALAPALMVLAETVWLRPRLGTRTQQIIKGGKPQSSSNLHLAYVACEAAKLAALLALGLADSGTTERANREAGHG